MYYSTTEVHYRSTGLQHYRCTEHNTDHSTTPPRSTRTAHHVPRTPAMFVCHGHPQCLYATDTRNVRMPRTLARRVCHGPHNAMFIRRRQQNNAANGTTHKSASNTCVQTTLKSAARNRQEIDTMPLPAAHPLTTLPYLQHTHSPLAPTLLL